MQGPSDTPPEPKEFFSKPQPWLLRTLVKGFITGLAVGGVMTVLVLVVVWFTSRESFTPQYLSDFWQHALPGIGLLGLLFAILAVFLVGVTKLLDRIRPRDD